jgi:hypothetical protein
MVNFADQDSRADERCYRERRNLTRNSCQRPAIVNKLLVGHAATVMTAMPAGSIDLIVTSPPYWTAVTYSVGNPWRSYEDYLADMQSVWTWTLDIPIAATII